MSKTSSAAKNRYNNKTYDRITIVIPKGRKADLQRIAESSGESVNSYITKSMFDRLGIISWSDLDDKI